MKISTILVIYLFAFLSIPAIAQKSEVKFGQHQILEDLDYLNKSLQDAHYNLYAYTSKEDFSKNYQEVKKSITQDSVTLLQATTIFPPLPLASR